jgi:hypothetical protein
MQNAFSRFDAQYVPPQKFTSILCKKGVESLLIIRLGRWESIAMVRIYTRSVKFEDSLSLIAVIENPHNSIVIRYNQN